MQWQPWRVPLCFLGANPMPLALPRMSSVMHPEVIIPYLERSPSVPQVWMVIPFSRAILPRPSAILSQSPSVMGTISGMFLSSFLYISTKLKMQRSTYGAILPHMSANASRWRSTVYLSVSRTGSYLHATLCLPTIAESSLSVSMLSSIDGTPGSTSLPYGVMV